MTRQEQVRLYASPQQFEADRRQAEAQGWRVSTWSFTAAGLQATYTRGQGDTVRVLRVAVAVVIALFVGVVVLQSLGLGNPNNAPRGAAFFSTPAPFQPSYDSARKGLAYDELFRHLESYVGQHIYFRGRVLQVVDDETLRMSWSDDPLNFDDVIVTGYSGDRVLEDDVLDVVATPIEVYTYKTVLGADRTVPALGLIASKYIRHQS